MNVQNNNLNLEHNNVQNILIVDDVADNLRLLSGILRKQGYEVRCARNGSSALNAVTAIIPNLILLDIQMPDLNGYEVCQKLKKKPKTRDIPIIFLSALDDVQNKVKGFEQGGVDYITKPFQVEEILIRVKNQLALQSAKAEIHQLNQILQRKIQNEKQRTNELEFINHKLQQEIIARQKVEQQLIHNSLHDSLTGLPNRSLLMKKLDIAIQKTNSNSNYLFALLFIDLDCFKKINDTLGHLIGDKLLVAVAKLLPEGLRNKDTVARLGGDEFVILLDDIESLQDTTIVVNRLLEKLKGTFQIDDFTVTIGASIGIAISSPNYQNSSQILQDADLAMYRAKENGKGHYEMFDRAMYIPNFKFLNSSRGDDRLESIMKSKQSQEMVKKEGKN
ncbi:Response regulator receiver modulated diguanylate cyclase/phosphodiesterase (fragment) [Hyella patelloides LEGE 07179]|uniref:Response regulator receiver modulated diguanylate cyclase/phosphodiesterase n=1 Tax=Hyella patelloides LEGE 07179 TaxID=945734 RepID=A0A563W2T3_9CYAN